MSDTQIHETFVQTAPASPSEDQVLIWAQAILEARFTRSNFLTSPVIEHQTNFEGER